MDRRGHQYENSIRKALDIRLAIIYISLSYHDCFEDFHSTFSKIIFWNSTLVLNSSLVYTQYEAKTYMHNKKKSMPHSDPLFSTLLKLFWQRIQPWIQPWTSHNISELLHKKAYGFYTNGFAICQGEWWLLNSPALLLMLMLKAFAVSGKTFFEEETWHKNDITKLHCS